MAVYSQDILLNYDLETFLVDIYRFLASLTGFCGLYIGYLSKTGGK